MSKFSTTIEGINVRNCPFCNSPVHIPNLHGPVKKVEKQIFTCIYCKVRFEFYEALFPSESITMWNTRKPDWYWSDKFASAKKEIALLEMKAKLTTGGKILDEIEKISHSIIELQTMIRKIEAADKLEVTEK